MLYLDLNAWSWTVPLTALWSLRPYVDSELSFWTSEPRTLLIVLIAVDSLPKLVTLGAQMLLLRHLHCSYHSTWNSPGVFGCPSICWSTTKHADLLMYVMCCCLQSLNTNLHERWLWLLVSYVHLYQTQRTSTISHSLICVHICW